MQRHDNNVSTCFRVMINHEEQYSFWPADQQLPKDWKDTGVVGTKNECLSYIDEVWTDLRPLSSRKTASAVV